MPKVVVVGSYIVDLMCRTPHIPKPGETVLGGSFQMGPGGKGGNQAVAAARLGSDVTMVTKVGKDVFGEEAIRNFQKEGIDISRVNCDEKEATGTALIAVDQHGENMIVVALGACGSLTEEDVEQARGEFADADIILVQLETSIEAVKKTIELANEFVKPVILNPAPYQEIGEDLLKGVTYITPNETEVFALTGIEVTNFSQAQKAAIKLTNKGVSTVIITLGRKGCFVYDGTDAGRMIAGYEVKAVDTTGAGDAFNGAFATFISQGFNLDEAARLSNSVAALSVTKIGTSVSMPYKEELDFLKDN
ncbi:ribokinase [Halalkalibacter akibai]|uniref:Ribokinase n=1 Tax=Halalkalibacter akibai (strain ATCC 43226 / DSM 21942 / CIP 109018 / JCM 9157 / 1139) TaxID=1236973 RepID=W4R1I6_HALA3|nr:ribokinase [Halalkalibacter akibai]GAE37404.1 ribokinase [Halalkalibacter akibai JCM 9157]